MSKYLTTPLTDEDIAELVTGDSVLISGPALTIRDASSKRLSEDIKAGQAPVELAGQLIFYLGPSPAPPGKVIGSAGPTTSARMDKYVPELAGEGVKAFMGKGRRSLEAREAAVNAGAVYLVAVGGVGALLSRHIGEAEIAAYPDLGPEAIYKLTLDEMPAVVANDIFGGDLFEKEWPAWSSADAVSS